MNPLTYKTLSNVFGHISSVDNTPIKVYNPTTQEYFDLFIRELPQVNGGAINLEEEDYIFFIMPIRI